MRLRILFGIAILPVLLAPAASRIETTDHEITLANEHVAITFDAERLRLQSWLDKRTGQPIFQGCGRSLFTLSLGSMPLEDYKSIRLALLAQAAFPKVSWHKTPREGGLALELHYDNAAVGDTLLTVSAVVEVFLPHDSPLSEWRLKVVNRSNMPLQEVEFPQFIGLHFPNSSDPAEKEFVACPLYSGIRCKNPRKRVVTGQGMSNYPGGGLSLQLLSYYNDCGDSFYFAAHDSENYTKTFTCVPAPSNTVAMSNIHYSDTRKAPGEWCLPYPVVAGPVPGDWYDCAQIYRKWTLGFDRWKPLHLRSDVPPDFQRLPLWWCGHPFNKKLADGNPALAARQTRLKQKFFPDIPLAFHWYMWYNLPRHDVDYPEIFLKKDDTLKQSVEAMQQAGVFPMFYTNILLFETFLPEWKNAAAAAGRGPYNQLNRDVGKRMWRSGDRRFLTGMCFGTDYWIQKMNQVFQRQYQELGLKFFYLDQLCNFPARCEARNHRHPASGGNYIAEGEREIARNIRKMGAPGEITIVGEGVTECCIDVVDGLLNGHCDTDPNTLPLFQTVYSDRTTEIGCFISRQDLKSTATVPAKLAFSLVRGRQLGWVNEDQFDAFEPSNRPYMKLFARYAKIRMAVPEFLFYGAMLRTPVLEEAGEVTIPWYTWVRGKLEQKRVPEVFAEAYRAPDGRVGVILANHTNQPKRVKLKLNRKDWLDNTTASLALRRLENLAWSQPEALPDEQDSLSVSVPPRDAVVLEFRK